MKKILLPCILSVFLSFPSHSQDLLNRVRNKVNQRANQKTDEAINKSLDKAEDTVTGKKTDTKTETNSDKQNTSSTIETRSSSTESGANGPSTELPIKAYLNFDFVPGDSVIFEDNFVGETTEEIPSLWVPTGGVVEITKINGETVTGFLDGFYTGMYPRMKKYNYLPQRFSVEFDYLFRSNKGKKWGQYRGEGSEGGLDIVFHSDDKDFDSKELGDYENGIRLESSGAVTFKEFRGKYKGVDDFGDAEIYDKWVHVSVAATERGMKIYLNNQRIVNAPIASGKAASIKIYSEGNTAEPDGRQLFIRNVRIAGGGKDPYKQLTSTAKATYIARGINFDYNKATLKPESMGEINKIIAILKDHPDLKFEIGGHTDGEGDDAYNLKLSQQRSDAVKAKLVELGVDQSRITSKGYGETKPIASNETPEGRAGNRRVELVKK